MKPSISSLALVTASVDPARAAACFQSWLGRSRYHLPVYVVWSDLPPLAGTTLRQATDQRQAGTRAILDAFTPGVTIETHHGGGVVPAFAQGVAVAFAEGAEAVVALHDDVLIEEQDWDHQILYHLARGMKLGGFGGATSLGSADLYQAPYNPMQLARGGFVSNMRDAEAHGRRSTVPVPCVAFDGFSQIGTRDWFCDAWGGLENSGYQHHAYDSALGIYAARAGVQPGLMIPIRCHHYGGRTAVGSEAYQAWAKTQHPDGDQGFWEASHRLMYEQGRGVLPLRVEGGGR